MNANELADELKYFHETLCDTGAINAVISGLKVKQIETMLRQQALEIKALHQILGYEGIKVGEEYLAECVADLRKAQEK